MNSKGLSNFVAGSLFSKASLALYLFVHLFLFTGRFYCLQISSFRYYNLTAFHAQ